MTHDGVVIIGNLDEPSVTVRESFGELLMKPDLRKAVSVNSLHEDARMTAHSR